MKRFIAYACIASALLWQSCSTGGDLAGGSGAGNPGGATAVAILADTTLDSTALQKAPKSDADIGRVLALSDDAALILSVESAKIPVYRIYFLLDNGVDCEALIEGFDSSLHCDTEGLMLDGPFLFDAITGMPDPRLDTLKLPVAQYRGIKIMVGCDTKQDTLECLPLEIAGTFDYSNASHDFSFAILFSTTLLYKYIGPPTLIDPNDTTLFEIRLNAKEWLSGIDFGARLADSTIVLDSLTGDLVLDDATASGSQKAITGAIRDNIAESFKTARIEIRASR